MQLSTVYHSNGGRKQPGKPGAKAAWFFLAAAWADIAQQPKLFEAGGSYMDAERRRACPQVISEFVSSYYTDRKPIQLPDVWANLK